MLNFESATSERRHIRWKRVVFITYLMEIRKMWSGSDGDVLCFFLGLSLFSILSYRALPAMRGASIGLMLRCTMGRLKQEGTPVEYTRSPRPAGPKRIRPQTLVMETLSAVKETPGKDFFTPANQRTFPWKHPLAHVFLQTDYHSHQSSMLLWSASDGDEPPSMTNHCPVVPKYMQPSLSVALPRPTLILPVVSEMGI